jgi:hypothetical protein
MLNSEVIPHVSQEMDLLAGKEVFLPVSNVKRSSLENKVELGVRIKIKRGRNTNDIHVNLIVKSTMSLGLSRLWHRLAAEWRKNRGRKD